MVYALETRDERGNSLRTTFFNDGMGQGVTHTNSYLRVRQQLQRCGLSKMGADDEVRRGLLEQICDYKETQRKYEGILW